MPVTPDTDLEERKAWLMSWAEDLKTEHAALAETPLTELIREQRCEIAAKQRALGDTRGPASAMKNLASASSPPTTPVAGCAAMWTAMQQKWRAGMLAVRCLACLCR